MAMESDSLPNRHIVPHNQIGVIMQASSVQTISLYFKQGASDKEYHASIDLKNGSFVVNFAYGRRGTTLQTGTKTNTPVDLETATKIFTKLVTEKKSKGYTEGEAGTPYQHTENENRVTNILPQLLNSIDEQEAERLILDDKWCAQEKFDGKRILLQKEGAAIHGINRKGLLVGLPSPVVAAAQEFKGDFILDGESIGETLHIFDLLRQNGEDLRAVPYHARTTALLNLLASREQRHIRPVDIAWKTSAKRELLVRLREQNKEGIVFKHREAPYNAGRPNSGGMQLKHKFCAALSALVGTINAKRSIEIKLLNGTHWVTAGNVTIPPNHTVPKVGEVVEVRYLYAFKESGCVYQPVYLGVRSDVTESECVTNQLKFKNGDEES
jgi:bifunctional non-homologous end joining protein LigD